MSLLHQTACCRIVFEQLPVRLLVWGCTACGLTRFGALLLSVLLRLPLCLFAAGAATAAPAAAAVHQGEDKKDDSADQKDVNAGRVKPNMEILCSVRIAPSNQRMPAPPWSIFSTLRCQLWWSRGRHVLLTQQPPPPPPPLGSHWLAVECVMIDASADLCIEVRANISTGLCNHTPRC